MSARENIYLVELTAVTDAAGSTTVLRYASKGYNTSPLDTPANTHYKPRLTQPGLMQRDMFSSGKTSGQTTVGYGVIQLVNNDGALDDLLNYGFAGQQVTVRLGDSLSALSTFSTILSATAEQADGDEKSITIRLKDKLLPLDAPLANSLYGGSNVLPAGVEGVDDIKGKNKPLILGRVFNAEPVLCNTTKLIYQVSASLVSAITAVYDRGSALTIGVARRLATFNTSANDFTFTANTSTNVLTTGLAHTFVTGDPIVVYTTTTLPAPLAANTYYWVRVTGTSTVTLHPTLADANANTSIIDITTTGTGTHSINNSLTISGRYDYCLDAAGSYFKLGATPTGQVTFDATAGATAADRTAAQLLVDIATAMGVNIISISASDVTALDVLNSAECGIYVTDSTTALSAMDDIAASIGAWYGYDASGTLRMGRLDAPSAIPVATLTTSNIINLSRITPSDETNGLPVWRVQLGYQKLYAVQTTDLAGAVTGDRRAVLAAEYRTSSAEDASVKVQFTTATTLTRNTLLTAKADADAETSRLLSLFKVRRNTYQSDVRLSAATLAVLDIGKVVTFVHPRYGFNTTGKPMLILGMKPDYQLSKVTLTLWG